MSLALKERGYDVHACANSRQALECARQLPSPPELLISDVDLGELSGPAMAAQLLTAFPAMTILFISGYPGVDAQLHPAISALNASFLSKPFSLQQFFTQVEKILAT
jgi:DNA-binding NtrC family response regulator